MKDFDLIILTCIVSILFIAFGIATYNEFSNAAKKDER
jgi:hypothetical protein